MKAVCQVVKCAALSESGKEISKIGRGLLVYIGFSESDTENGILKALNKICGLRVFADDNGKLNLSLSDIEGQMLLVSNFTLYADLSRGFRPSFVKSAKFDKAYALYEFCLDYISKAGIDVKPGVFGGDMIIQSSADGPVNIIADSEEL